MYDLSSFPYLAYQISETQRQWEQNFRLISVAEHSEHSITWRPATNHRSTHVPSYIGIDGLTQARMWKQGWRWLLHDHKLPVLYGTHVHRKRIRTWINSSQNVPKHSHTHTHKIWYRTQPVPIATWLIFANICQYLEIFVGMTHFVRLPYCDNRYKLSGNIQNHPSQCPRFATGTERRRRPPARTTPIQRPSCSFTYVPSSFLQPFRSMKHGILLSFQSAKHWKSYNLWKSQMMIWYIRKKDTHLLHHVQYEHRNVHSLILYWKKKPSPFFVSE